MRGIAEQSTEGGQKLVIGVSQEEWDTPSMKQEGPCKMIARSFDKGTVSKAELNTM
jgi:hypothetical protein